MLTGTLLLIGGWRADAAAEEELVRFTPEQRARIDDGALWSERERVNVPGLEAHASLVEWLVTRAPLPADQEQRRTAARIAEVRELTEATDVAAEMAAAIQPIVEKLAAALPERMRREIGDIKLVAMHRSGDGGAANAASGTLPQPLSQSVGGGLVFVQEKFLRAALADAEAGADQLAGVVAHELGHMALGHARRRYQRQWLQEELKKDVELSEKLKDKESVKGLIQGGGLILEHVYTREEDFEADLFAIHLCRNAGFDLENCLDVLRAEAVRRDAKLLEPPPPRTGTPPLEPQIQPNTDGEKLFLAEHPPAVHRLRRLRLELDGVVIGERFGLLEYHRESGELKRAADGRLADNASAVVCVHGMESSAEAYRSLLKLLAEQQAAASPRLFAFQFPHDDSLARAGKFLRREVQRVGASGEKLDFVCHSAGGLVFRWYAEIEGGGFHRTIFQGTPHHGSDLASLRSLLEAGQFLGDVNLGYDQALEQAIIDGHGQITFDLQPDSLFLRYLNRAEPQEFRQRYSIQRGRAFTTGRVLLLTAGLAAARRSTREVLERQFPMDQTVLAKFIRAGVDRLDLPAEISNGDSCVTLKSAALDGVTTIDTFPLKHTELPRHADAMRAVAEAIAR